MTDAEIKAQIARVEKERMFLATKWRFYGVLLSVLPNEWEAPAGINTAATDGRRIYWNLTWVSTLTRDNVLFTAAHEVLHVALLHHTRMVGLDPRLVNIAGDHVINIKLVEEQIGEMPKGALLDWKYKGWSMEDVYADLEQQEKAEKEAQQTPKDQSGSEAQDEGDQGDEDEGEGPEGGSQEPQEAGEDGSGCQDTGEGQTAPSEAPEASKGQAQGNQGSQDGTGDEGQMDPGGCGGVIPATGDAVEQAEDKRALEGAIRKAVAAAARQAGGKVGEIGKLVLDALGACPVRWEDELEEFISQSISTDYSWSRPDRRFDGRPFMLPGQVPDAAAHGVLMIDSSGSMDDTQCKQCVEAVQGIMDSGAVDRVTVVCIDTDIRNVEEFERGDSITMDVNGRGGTKYQPAWAWLAEQDELPDFVVYMTDLEPWSGFGDEPDVPVLWACSTYSPSARRALRQRMDAVPFGRCVELQ